MPARHRGPAVIADPDLVECWAGEHPETSRMWRPFCAAGAEGYPDYPMPKAG
jgi:N-ethylmaleimide reductase